MKRTLCVLACLALLMGILPAACAAGVSDVMCVYNCQEWVSLREAPDTNAKRLEKVHLGELVTDCQAASNNFIRCEFNGKVGYILNTYLKTTNFSNGESFPGNQMVVNCSEWVSLREAPDTSSKQLAKVPLGTVVTACVSYMGTFISCEYKGQRGYIPTTYLKNANYNAKTQDQKVISKSEGQYAPVSGAMTVVNCNEWVSLREKASTSAARLAKVPLGAQVTGCVQTSNTFIYCSYNGLWGYIQADYLAGDQLSEPGWDESRTTFAHLPTLPSYDTFMSAGSTLVMAETYQGYTIVVRRAYSDSEELMAVCYNLSNEPLWELRETSLFGITDTVQTDAFVGGVTENPLLIWYISGKGFFAYEYGPQLKMRWAVPESAALSISNSILHQVHYDGTIYVAYDDCLLCISPDGVLSWKASCDDPDIFWPCEISIGDQFIDVTYDNHPEEESIMGLVRYSKDGFVLLKSVKVVPN